MTDGPWAQAVTALRLLSIDPSGLGGLWLRARAGPVRDAAFGLIPGLLGQPVKLHPAWDRDAFLGGLDLARTLTSHHECRNPGLLARDAAFLMPSGERLEPEKAAWIAAALGRDGAAGTRRCLVLGDESGAPDEVPPVLLTEQLGLFVDLTEVPLGDIDLSLARAGAAARPLAEVALAPADIDEMVTVAARLGIDSLRAPLYALAAARAHAALMGRAALAEADKRAAVELVYTVRATQLPAEEAPAEPPPPPEDRQENDNPADAGQGELPQDLLVQAVALRMAELRIERAHAARRRGAGGDGAGAKVAATRRGSPKPSRPGRLDGRGRIDLIGTLRRAVPWQTLRGAGPGGTAVRILPSDIQIKRYEHHSDRVLVFVVDASGSTAMTRLAEAKGAVELFLSRAYARRDHVALIGFRGTGAEILLAPTRSLVQTKKQLAALPGGGGTPLAAGLVSAGDLARMSRRHGLSPSIVVMTDGKANVALDGRADRAAARADGERAARAIRLDGFDLAIVDSGTRPNPYLKDLAGQIDADYVPLPRADAHGLSRVAGALLDS